MTHDATCAETKERLLNALSARNRSRNKIRALIEEHGDAVPSEALYAALAIEEMPEAVEDVVADLVRTTLERGFRNGDLGYPAASVYVGDLIEEGVRKVADLMGVEEMDYYINAYGGTAKLLKGTDVMSLLGAGWRRTTKAYYEETLKEFG